MTTFTSLFFKPTISNCSGVNLLAHTDKLLQFWDYIVEKYFNVLALSWNLIYTAKLLFCPKGKTVRNNVRDNETAASVTFDFSLHFNSVKNLKWVLYIHVFAQIIYNYLSRLVHRVWGSEQIVYRFASSTRL